MSDYTPSMPPLMSPVKARDLARICQGMADHLREVGDDVTARVLERRSAWWLHYASVLAQLPPGAKPEWEV